MKYCMFIDCFLVPELEHKITRRDTPSVTHLSNILHSSQHKYDQKNSLEGPKGAHSPSCPSLDHFAFGKRAIPGLLLCLALHGISRHTSCELMPLFTHQELHEYVPPWSRNFSSTWTCPYIMVLHGPYLPCYWTSYLLQLWFLSYQAWKLS